MLANKHPDAILAPLAPRLASIAVVPVPGHDHHVATAFGPDARPAASVEAALSGLTVDPATEIVLIAGRSEEHTSELQSLMRISYAVFCLKKKITKDRTTNTTLQH